MQIMKNEEFKILKKQIEDINKALLAFDECIKDPNKSDREKVLESRKIVNKILFSKINLECNLIAIYQGNEDYKVKYKEYQEEKFDTNF